MNQRRIKTTEPRQRMSRNRQGILAGIALVVFGIGMAAWHWLLTGINEDFGTGVVVGAAVMFGLLAVCLRSVREL